MADTAPFEIPPAAAHASYLARVVAVDDPLALGRVQVRLVNFDGAPDHDAPVWARVAVPFAGGNRGAFLLPDVGDEVLVTLVNGDARHPVVVGGLWNGRDAPPETLGGAGDRVDRWTLVGKAGTRIAIVEERAGGAVISLTTPGRAQSVEITESSGGGITLSAAGSTIVLDTKGITLRTAAKVTVEAASMTVKAGTVKVDTAIATFTNLVKCNTLIATTVVSKTYTPGAGNVW
jgi:uncharacterized protein involved in type VI secretion and phage assembly